MPSDLPFVTVVVPVLNAAARTERTLSALSAQSYPEDRFEVVVVDNGSTDATREVVGRYPARLIEEEIRSPYAARNAGIRAARGDIVALLDVNCCPAPEWLERGVAALESTSADLAGGKVSFTYSPERTAAELFDSVSNVKMETSIRERSMAKTGNLFVRRRVFDEIGLFPSDVRSGADVLWTRHATRAGKRLVYAAEAEATYPARKLGPLLRKQFRVGQGQPAIWRDAGVSVRKMWIRPLLALRPPSRDDLRGRIEERGTPEMLRRFNAIWLNAWLCVLATAAGQAVSIALGRTGWRGPASPRPDRTEPDPAGTTDGGPASSPPAPGRAR